MIGTEAVVLAVLGALIGIAAGTGLGTALCRSLRHNGIPDLDFPWVRLATYLGLTVLIGLLAAIAPAIRAAGTGVLPCVARRRRTSQNTPGWRPATAVSGTERSSSCDLCQDHEPSIFASGPGCPSMKP
jgi:hypothetical protein